VKKLVLVMAMLTAVMLLAGCQRSNIVIEDTDMVPDGVILPDPNRETEAKETVPTTAYTIPEGATGPGDVTLGADTYANYDDDKKPASTENVIQVRYFYINSKGLNEEYDVLEGKDCNAENLNELLIGTGVLVDGTEVVNFETDGTNGTLTLNQLKGQSSYATAELLAQALANTYTDNLGLDYLTVIVDGETYGPLEYEKPQK